LAHVELVLQLIHSFSHSLYFDIQHNADEITAYYACTCMYAMLMFAPAPMLMHLINVTIFCLPIHL